MKYLKKYNESYDKASNYAAIYFKDNIEYLKDIFQDLIDDNYNIDIDPFQFFHEHRLSQTMVSINGIKIKITNYKGYKLENIYDYVLTAKSYMEDVSLSARKFTLYDMGITILGGNSYGMSMENILRGFSEDTIESSEIRFKLKK